MGKWEDCDMGGLTKSNRHDMLETVILDTCIARREEWQGAHSSTSLLVQFLQTVKRVWNPRHVVGLLEAVHPEVGWSCIDGRRSGTAGGPEAGQVLVVEMARNILEKLK